MKLDSDVNFIVSGIERSGTSMLMQILSNGGIPVSSDESRPPDENNPKGYYELEGGKIINKLMEGSFPFDRYKGCFIKVTAYGIQYLPKGNYKIIYTERNIEEVLESMEKMADVTDDNREETKNAFINLNTMIKSHINERDDLEVLYLNYNEILRNPAEEIKKIPAFLNLQDIDFKAMVQTVDEKLYRKRH
ncbi:MAG: sulfotransferase domain-containing protein [Candidatus Aminicenantaceae bacterium]